MFKRGDIANNLFLICFTHMECILCGWGRIGYSDVSIHAPARGATIAYCTGTENIVVSVLAPTRGATRALTGVTAEELFQSTHPHGVRLPASLYRQQRLQFQSTHPHGVRQYIFQSADFLIYMLIFLRTSYSTKLKSNRLTKKRCN